MNDGQRQTVNHIYHFLRDLLDKYENGTFLSNGRKPSDTDIKHMIWYLETNFPKDMLEHEMGDRGFLDEDEEQLRSFENEGGSTYSEQMQDDLEPIADDEELHDALATIDVEIASCEQAIIVAYGVQEVEDLKKRIQELSKKRREIEDA